MRLSQSRRIDLFWMQVERSPTCWTWEGDKNSDGYGRFAWMGKATLAHRLSWKLELGDIPEPFVIDHICRNRACVRPMHLRLATSKENAENKSTTVSHSRTGRRGVTLDTSRKRIKRFRARVKHAGRWHSAGYYKTADEAEEAARRLRLKLFTHNFSDSRSSDGKVI